MSFELEDKTKRDFVGAYSIDLEDLGNVNGKILRSAETDWRVRLTVESILVGCHIHVKFVDAWTNLDYSWSNHETEIGEHTVTVAVRKILAQGWAAEASENSLWM